MRAFTLSLFFVLSACSSTPPPTTPVEMHNVAPLTHADLETLARVKGHGTVTVVALPSGNRAFCRPAVCEVGWVRARLPVSEDGRPLAVLEDVRGKVALTPRSVGDLMTLMDSARRLGRVISYHENDAGVACSGESCGLDLKVWVDTKAQFAPRVETEAARVQALVQGALRTR